MKSFVFQSVSIRVLSDNQSALNIRKGRFQLYSSKSYVNNLVNTYLYSFNQSVLWLEKLCPKKTIRVPWFSAREGFLKILFHEFGMYESESLTFEWGRECLYNYRGNLNTSQSVWKLLPYKESMHNSRHKLRCQ